MNSDLRGATSEMKVKSELMSLGYITSTPDASCKYDLVVDYDGELLKVQVKRGFKDKSRDKTLRVNMYDQNKNGVPNNQYSSSDIDAFVIDDPINDLLYWLWFEEAPNSEMRRKYSSLSKHILENKI